MQPDVEKKLLSLNREFYQTFAEPFADSRNKPQPGVASLLPHVAHNQPVLDLGCGNGSLADALWKRGHEAHYLGLDNSPALLAWARQHCSHPQAKFRQADLAEKGWPDAIDTGPFPWIFCLAVLHHIPGAKRRQRWATSLHPLLSPGGTAVISVWNFPAEEKWRDRVLPWSTVGLTEEQVEPGDALLDWRRGGRGLRYVHHFEPAELRTLAAAAGCQVSEQIEAGGESGRLNRLQLWKAKLGPNPL